MSVVSDTQENSGFWSRQFQSRPTTGQVVFDLAFGFALPLICVWFDPIVFRASSGEPLLGRYATLAAVAISLGLLSLAAWMLIGRPPALFAGFLSGAAIFATLLGLVLLPLSIAGLIVLVGVLGFSPFATAFVFFRNATRAYQKAIKKKPPSRVRVYFVLGLITTCTLPWAAQWYMKHELSRATELVRSQDPSEAARGIVVLKRFRLFSDFDELVSAYEVENDPRRREQLAGAYRELMGDEIEERLSPLD